MAGNANSGRREKPFAEALMMELKAAGKDSRKLRSIASQLIAKAEAGEGWAIQVLADRLDGRPAQQVALEHDVTGDLKDLLEALNGRTRGIPKSA